jgi:hypothetical protein
MKKIKTTDIIAGSAMPLKSGSLNHLQSANQEGIFSLAQSELFQRNGVSAGYANPQALYGLAYTIAGSTWSIESGCLVFGTEMYLCDSTIGISLGLGQVVIGTITTTYLTATNADPVVFSDSTSNNVHEIRKIVWSAGTSGSPGTIDFVNIQYLGRWIEQTYSAGNLTTSNASTWTIPAGASNFKVKTQRRGSTMIVDFYINQSSITSVSGSAAPTYLSLSLAITDRIKGNFRTICYYQNPSAALDSGACRVIAVSGTREIRFTPVTVANWDFEIGSADVYGQIAIELDNNES